MNIRDRIEKILGLKIKPEDFFENRQIKEMQQDGYKKVCDLPLGNLSNKEEVKDRLSKYLAPDVTIKSVEYGWMTLPPYEFPGYYAGTKWSVGKRDIAHVWKIDIEKNGQKLSLATLNGDLAVFQSQDKVKFNQYPKDYLFDDSSKAIVTSWEKTGGSWNEAKVTRYIPQFRYDGEKIEPAGATEIKGLDYHGNGGGSFRETDRKVIPVEDFNKIRHEYEVRQQNMASNQTTTRK